jgi:hypothetical protein
MKADVEPAIATSAAAAAPVCMPLGSAATVTANPIQK